MPARPLISIALCGLVAACGTTPSPPATGEVATFPAAPRPDMDVLLLVDNTNSADFDHAFAAALGTLWTTLAARPGGLPNLHVGVATSDLGTTGSLDRTAPAAGVGSGQGACAGSGDAAALGVHGAPITGAFLSDVANAAGGRDVNYTGAIGDVLSQLIAGVGVSGCGFEQTLAAVGAALANPANAGFRRPGAGLAVIVLSDEDDCSVRDAAFFDPSPTPLGPLASFRCTTQGVTCAEPLTTAGAKTSCAPAAGGDLDDVSALAAAVSAAEPDPQRRAVAAIVAPATPFGVELRADGGAPPALALAHSCSVTGASGGVVVADPAVRTAAWAAALGGAVYPICAQTYDPIAAALGRQLLAVVDGDPCLHGALLDAAHPACTVREDATAIPACPAAGTCFTIAADPAACPTTETHLRVAVQRTAPASADATIHVTCELP